MIKAILFDLDNTLFPEEEYFRAIFDRFAANHSRSLKEFDFLFEDFNKVRFGEKDIFGYVLSSWSARNQMVLSVRAMKECREELFSYFCNIQFDLLPYSGVQEWINCAIEHKLKVGVLTNGLITPQSNKWGCLRLKHKDQIIFMPARSLGADKPHPLTFKAANIALAVSSVECLYVGDRYENDLAFGVENGAFGILLGTKNLTTKLPKTVFQVASAMDAFGVFKSLLIPVN